MKAQLENAALIIIDMQEGFNDPSWGKRNNVHLEKNVALILSHWRKNKLPIYHVQHLSQNPKSSLHESHAGVNFMECAKPLDQEPVVQKKVNSCFIGTDMEFRLRQRKIETLVFVGIASDHCASTSTRMAANLGFNCLIVSDGTTSFDRKDHNGIVYPGDLVHSVSLASLHGEFAEVIDTKSLLEVER